MRNEAYKLLLHLACWHRRSKTDKGKEKQAKRKVRWHTWCPTVIRWCPDQSVAERPFAMNSVNACIGKCLNPISKCTSQMLDRFGMRKGSRWWTATVMTVDPPLTLITILSLKNLTTRELFDQNEMFSDWHDSVADLVVSHHLHHSPAALSAQSHFQPLLHWRCSTV